MNHAPISRWLAGIALSAGTASAFAHDGHGLGGSHWHATDTLGLLLVAALALAAVWLARK